MFVCSVCVVSMEDASVQYKAEQGAITNSVSESRNGALNALICVATHSRRVLPLSCDRRRHREGNVQSSSSETLLILQRSDFDSPVLRAAPSNVLLI